MPGMQELPAKKRKIKETLCFEVLDVLFVGAGGFSCSLKALLGGVRIKVLNFYPKLKNFYQL